VAAQLGFSHGSVPQVDLLSAKARYETLFAAIQAGLVSACHDCSDGGLGVTLAEMCIGGRLGARIDLAAVPACGELDATGLLYAESASRLVVSVPAAHAGAFEALFAGQACARIGAVDESGALKVVRGADPVLGEPVADLAAAFKKTLDW
jgi:phosphoribosylformylglycinamidine synthase